VSRHEQRLDGRHTALGVDGAESLVGVADEGEGQLMAFGGPRMRSRTSPVRKGRSTPRTRLRSKRACRRPVKMPPSGPACRFRRVERAHEGLGRIQVGLRRRSLPREARADRWRGRPSAFRKRQEGLVASHPPASTAGKDDAAEPSAGLHRPLLAFFARLMLASMIPHPGWGTGPAASTSAAPPGRS